MESNKKFAVVYPKGTSAFTQRLWRKGAKRLIREVLGDSVAIEETALAPDQLEQSLAAFVAAGVGVVLAESLFAERERKSFLTPLTAPAAARVSPINESLKAQALVLDAPTMAYWAFPNTPTAPVWMTKAAESGKQHRTMLALSGAVTPPPQRLARAQSFMEFMKWEMAEVLDEMVVKHALYLTFCDEVGTTPWDLYDILLRSRKPELVRIQPDANADQQYAAALNSRCVITDSVELAASCLPHGKRVLLLGGLLHDSRLQAHPTADFLHLPDFAANAQRLREFLFRPFDQGGKQLDLLNFSGAASLFSSTRPVILVA